MDSDTSFVTEEGHTGGSRKKAWLVLVILSCIVITSAMVVMYKVTIEQARDMHNSLTEQESISSVAPVVLNKTDEPDSDVTQGPVEETFEAMLIKVADDASYVRMGVEGRGALSFEMGKDTRVTTYEGVTADIKDFSPLTRVRVSATKLSSTAPYDMRALSISRALSPEEEREAQRKIMSDLHLDYVQ